MKLYTAPGANHNIFLTHPCYYGDSGSLKIYRFDGNPRMLMFDFDYMEIELLWGNEIDYR
jgi:hypothetical protein